MKKNVIVTGIPRGGTTLTTVLLDNLTNFVCLSEPLWQIPWIQQSTDADELAGRLAQDFTETRRKILNKEPVLDRRNRHGKPVTNYYNRGRDGSITKSYELQSVLFQVQDRSFSLGMKHNALYTGILPQLVKLKSFSIIAVIRHPIPTILSWRSLNLPVSRGRLPAGERFWPALRDVSLSKCELLEKQVKIYDLFCRRYIELGNQILLLKYEDITRDPSLFEKISGMKYRSEIGINNQNWSEHYDFGMAADIRKKLQRYAPHAIKLYLPDE